MHVTKASCRCWKRLGHLNQSIDTWFPAASPGGHVVGRLMVVSVGKSGCHLPCRTGSAQEPIGQASANGLHSRTDRSSTERNARATRNRVPEVHGTALNSSLPQGFAQEADMSQVSTTPSSRGRAVAMILIILDSTGEHSLMTSQPPVVRACRRKSPKMAVTCVRDDPKPSTKR